uniref:Reverse transcriptase Ty1/copia-type domain-containing protein n=1 Tax=Solanum lycopersicum TaxID=4081 RepID=A0A3Q7ITD9_SOLLC
IEVAQSRSGIVISQHKYLVGKLNNLIVTRPDISFPISVASVVSQFMTSPLSSHWEAIVRILRYIKSAPGKGLLYEDQGHEHITRYTDVDWAGSLSDRRSTFGYCVVVGGNLVSWKSKKKGVVTRSSAESEYRAMVAATCELNYSLFNKVWLNTYSVARKKSGEPTHCNVFEADSYATNIEKPMI